MAMFSLLKDDREQRGENDYYENRGLAICGDGSGLPLPDAEPGIIR